MLMLCCGRGLVVGCAFAPMCFVPDRQSVPSTTRAFDVGRRTSTCTMHHLHATLRSLLDVCVPRVTPLLCAQVVSLRQGCALP